MIKLYGINLVELGLDKICMDTSLLDGYLSHLSNERSEKVLQCKSTGKRVQEFGAGLLLNYALKTFGMDEKTVQYAHSEHGKPYIIACPECHFNLSHAGDYVICVISDENVGCDIERIRTCKMKIAKRFFLQEEYEQLQNLEGDAKAQADLFFKLWTFKESYLKMTGTGLATGLDTMPKEGDGVVHQKWYEQIPEYVVAVCCENKKEILPEYITLIESLTELISL